MKNQLVIFSLLFLIFVSCNSISKKNEPAIVFDDTIPCADPAFDTQYPPQSKPFIFKSGGNEIAGRILMAAGQNPKPTILFLHGNPGHEKNEDIGQALRRVGYNSVYYSYSGTWGNEGIFSYKASVNDTKALIDYLVNNSKRYRINSEEIYLCGFSMGADVAILSGSSMKEVKGIISINPWNGHYVLNQYSSNKIAAYIKNVEQRKCIKVASGEEFVNEIVNTSSLDLNTSLQKSDKPILHIFSSMDDKEEFQEHCSQKNEENFTVLYACDHSFSDKRIALINTIFNWLKNKAEDN